jgi:hypothetical protein
MNKHLDTQILVEFSQDYDIDVKSVSGWSKQYENFELHVFSAVFETDEILNKFWQPLNDRIAVSFQPKLEKEIEAWNIYLIFLIKNPVSKKVKYKIEQDKFSCRKLVFDNFNEEEWGKLNEIEDAIPLFISERLFDIKLVKSSITSELTLQEVLVDSHSNLLSIINADIDKVNHKLVFDKFLKTL